MADDPAFEWAPPPGDLHPSQLAERRYPATLIIEVEPGTIVTLSLNLYGGSRVVIPNRGTVHGAVFGDTERLYSTIDRARPGPIDIHLEGEVADDDWLRIGIDPGEQPDG